MSEDGSAYNPYEHRDRIKLISGCETFANFMKSSLGAALFAMPNAFACVGVVIGVIGTMLIGLLLTVSLQFLLKIHYSMCVVKRKPTMLYDEIVTTALANGTRKTWISPTVAKFIIDVMILACYLGIGAVYVIFIAEVLQECFGWNETLGLILYIVILFPFLLVMNLAKYTRQIAMISIMGNIFVMTAITIGIVYALKDGIGDKWELVAFDPTLYPKFIGMVFFSMSSPVLVLLLEHSTKNPLTYSSFCGILNSGMTIVVIVNSFVGAVGYIKWGTESLGNFIRNHLEHDIPTLTALVMQASAMYFTYGLQLYPVVTLMLNNYVIPEIEERRIRGSINFWDLITRFGATLVTCLMGIAVPKLDLFTGLVGATTISTLTVIIPSILYILIHYENYGKYKWRLILGAAVLTIGILATICAVFTNVIHIAEYFKHGG